LQNEYRCWILKSARLRVNSWMFISFSTLISNIHSFAFYYKCRYLCVPYRARHWFTLSYPRRLVISSRRALSSNISTAFHTVPSPTNLSRLKTLSMSKVSVWVYVATNTLVSSSSTAIPVLLEKLTNEYDTLVLESFYLKKHLHETR
jgi:hypothetical protein